MAKVNFPLPDESAQSKRTARIREAALRMRDIADHMPRGVDGTEIIRRFRETSGSLDARR
ncbi:MAG: hypothetical protein Kow0056_06290 [Coriobacteriia bacterium]